MKERKKLFFYASFLGYIDKLSLVLSLTSLKLPEIELLDRIFTFLEQAFQKIHKLNCRLSPKQLKPKTLPHFLVHHRLFLNASISLFD